jgi:hypothetical protein
MGGGERGCKRAGHAPPHLAAAARMARDAEGRRGGGSWLQAALGIRRVAMLLYLVSSAAAAASKALRARSAQLLARAWLPNNALAT